VGLSCLLGGTDPPIDHSTGLRNRGHFVVASIRTLSLHKTRW
jgi:hypothetical protein